MINEFNLDAWHKWHGISNGRRGWKINSNASARLLEQFFSTSTISFRGNALGILDQNTRVAPEKQIDVLTSIQCKAQSALHNYVRASVSRSVHVSCSIPAQLSAPLKETTIPSVPAVAVYLSQWFLRRKYICPLMPRTLVAILAMIRPCEGLQSLYCEKRAQKREVSLSS